MRRLVYSPKVNAYIRTDSGTVDVSQYIVQGQVHRKINAVSSASLVLRNPQMMFTQPGSPAFHPMDAITIYLTRIKNRPIQVFTGYLDQTPYLELFPGTVSLTASCTLKRLLYTYFDPALPYTMKFLAQYGWAYNPQTGQVFNSTALNANDLDLANNGQLTDGSMGQLLFAILKHIGAWTDDQVYIEKLPDGLLAKIGAIYTDIEQQDQAILPEVTQFLSKLVGAGSAGSGALGPDPGDTMGGDPSKKYSAGGLAALAKQAGFPASAIPMAVAIAMAESTGDPQAVNTNTDGSRDRGLWQINDHAHPDVSDKCAFNPLCNAKAAYRISNGGTNWTPWSTFNSGAYKEFFNANVKPGGNAPAIDPHTINGPHGLAPGVTAQQQQSQGATTSTSGRSPGGKSGGSSTQTTRLDAIVAEANRMASLQVPYQLGGGHSTPSPKNGPWDCSSSVSRLLQNAGYNVPTFDTTLVPKLFPKGKGSRVTIWCRPLAGASGHVFIEIEGKTWGTSDQNPGGGPGWTHYSKIPYDSTFQPFQVPGGDHSLDEPASTPRGADTNLPGGTGSGDTTDPTGAAAFGAVLNFPNIQEVTEAMLLRGQKSLMNDQSLFPYMQQVCQASMRSFMSAPDGSFFAFFPDYFGGFGKRVPYWIIDDVEILDGGISLNDDALATHVYVVGDTVGFPDGTIDMMEKLQSAGVMTIFDAFKSDFIDSGIVHGNDTTTPATIKRKSKGALQKIISEVEGEAITIGKQLLQRGLAYSDALNFLNKYGARPHYEEATFVRSPYFELLLAWQKWMLLWSKTYSSRFSFTFMPEVYPGGLVGFKTQGIQCYVEEVIHTFDYGAGFQTEAILSCPAAMAGTTTDVSRGMVRAFSLADAITTSAAQAGAKGQ